MTGPLVQEIRAGLSIRFFLALLSWTGVFGRRKYPPTVEPTEPRCDGTGGDGLAGERDSLFRTVSDIDVVVSELLAEPPAR